MLGQHVRQFRDRHAPEATIAAEPEVREILPSGLQTRFEASHVVNHAEIDAGTTKPLASWTCGCSKFEIPIFRAKIPCSACQIPCVPQKNSLLRCVGNFAEATE